MSAARKNESTSLGRSLLGQRFGRLVVSGPSPGKSRSKQWACECDCGCQHVTSASSLRRGATRSCGCLHREELGNRRRTHGSSESLTYKRWRSMRARCLLPNTRSYARYGGRGITICESWSDFTNFIADMGECPPGYTIEREDNNGPYAPGNCRWATRKEQNRNTSANRRLLYQGQNLCVSEWAERVGIKYRTILMRLERGWPAERILTTPVPPQKQRVRP